MNPCPSARMNNESWAASLNILPGGDLVKPSQPRQGKLELRAEEEAQWEG